MLSETLNAYFATIGGNSLTSHEGYASFSAHRPLYYGHVN